MQTADEHILSDSVDSHLFAEHDSENSHDNEPHGEQLSEMESEETTEQTSDYSDDPVRVYLREMGSIRLLNRQAEIDLAQRIERGHFRMQKALSRCPQIRKMALELAEEIHAERLDPEEVLNIGGADAAEKRRSRLAAQRGFKSLAELEHELNVLQVKHAESPAKRARKLV